MLLEFVNQIEVFQFDTNIYEKVWIHLLDDKYCKIIVNIFEFLKRITLTAVVVTKSNKSVNQDKLQNWKLKLTLDFFVVIA